MFKLTLAVRGYLLTLFSFTIYHPCNQSQLNLILIGVTQPYFRRTDINHFIEDKSCYLFIQLPPKQPKALRNSAVHDEMPPYAAFHHGVHYLLKYLFTSIQNEKG